MLTPEQRITLERWAKSVLPAATAFARSLVRDPSSADDLVQECLYKLLKKSKEYNLSQDGTKLLFKSISNLCISQQTRKRELTTLDQEAITQPDVGSASPELEAQRAELDAAIRQAIATLPELQRAAIELRSLGFENEEIADVLNVSASNAAVLVFRARKQLLSMLGDSVKP